MKILSFLRHYLTASTRYQVHSPFVYAFVSQVLPHKKSPEGAKIEYLRKTLAGSAETIHIQDYGAGYGGNALPQIQKTISEVVAGSARKRREGELLKRIAAFYQPKTVLELGTNLGFSTLYLSAGLHPGAQITTVEGSESLAAIASGNFIKMGRPVNLIQAEFSHALSSEINLAEMKPELVFLDGNHKQEPTLNYFDTIVPHMPNGSIFILDDIHWSEGMHRAWKTIIQKPEVTVSLDLFSLGICFIRRNQAKEHFNLRFVG